MGSRVAAVSSFHYRLFPLCSHQLHPPKPSLSDKASAAAQYYLSRARYSPLRSRHNGGVKVAFGSGAPRWPASKPPPAPAKHEPKQEAFRPQSFFTKPLFGGHPPAVGRRGADQPVLKKDLHPSYQDMRGRGWKSTGPCRPSVPSMVSGAAYHSALASTQRANIHGRTDWTSKWVCVCVCARVCVSVCVRERVCVCTRAPTMLTLLWCLPPFPLTGMVQDWQGTIKSCPQYTVCNLKVFDIFTSEAT